MKKTKKSAYKAMAEAIHFNGLKNFDIPTKRADVRKLTVDEIKQAIQEEFAKAWDAADEEVQDPPKGWGDADLAKHVEWLKAQDIKEFFVKDAKKKK